ILLCHLRLLPSVCTIIPHPAQKCKGFSFLAATCPPPKRVFFPACPHPLPPPTRKLFTKRALRGRGRGKVFFLSQGGLWPPWESPFSKGAASLHEGGV